MIKEDKNNHIIGEICELHYIYFFILYNVISDLDSFSITT